MDMGRGQGQAGGVADTQRGPHPRSFPEEPEARALHSSLGVTFGTNASYHIGHIKLERSGFANIPRLLMTVQCKAQDVPALIPICRQAAFAYLSERGVSDEHLAFKPSVAQGSKRQSFTDQHGKRKMGEAHKVSFDLSETLASAVEWDWAGHGSLKADWQVS